MRPWIVLVLIYLPLLHPMSLAAFLKSTKSQFVKSAAQLARLTLVTGNQSSDMDSVVSAIAYSYFSKASTSGLVVPLLNIPRADLKLRRDIEYALSGIGISADDLVFADDLGHLSKGVELEIVLVDHNKPEGENEELIMKAFSPAVVGVIDHHADEGLFLKAAPRIIQVAGSCSTLVLTHFKQEVLKAEIDLETAKFLVSAILLDTGNLTDPDKTTKEDLAIIATLQKRYPTLTNEVLQKQNKQLKKLKKSIDGFTFRDILRKDFKEYACGNFKLGISSVKGSLEELEQQFGHPTLLSSLKEWKLERKLDLMAVMTSYNTQPDKAHHRQLLFVGTSEIPLVSGSLSAIKDTLQLERKVTVMDEDVLAFEQVNAAASRKQVAPLLTDYLMGQ